MAPKLIRSNGNGSDNGSGVVDLNEVREQRTQEKKKRAERVFFKNILNSFFVRDDGQLVPIDMVDVSDTGCSFLLPYHSSADFPQTSNHLPLRIYFSSEFYLEIFVKILNSNQAIDGKLRMVRFGCQVEESQKAMPAWAQFIKFLKAYAEYSLQDAGRQAGLQI